MTLAPTVSEVAGALSPDGLILRGGFNFTPDDAPPAGPSGAPARSVLLVGQAGAAPWPHFQSWLEKQLQPIANPLDTWSRQTIGAVAAAWFHDANLGGIIAAAMIINMFVAAVAGILIPLLLDHLRVDPAVASAVFVTTVTDVVGFFAFLGLATWWFAVP